MVKYLTALAFIVGPISTVLAFACCSECVVNRKDRDQNWAQVTCLLVGLGLFSDAWLIARYIL